MADNEELASGAGQGSKPTKTTVAEPAGPSWSATPFYVFGAMLFLAAAFVALLSPPSNDGIAATTVLAFVAVLAVGVERVVELFFSIIDRREQFGGWWPLNQVSQSITNYETNTDAILTGPLKKVVEGLESAKSGLNQSDAEFAELEEAITDAKATVADLEKRRQDLGSLAPGSPRLILLTGIAGDALDTIDRTVDEFGERVGAPLSDVRRDAKRLAAACDRGVDVISTFSDNPARRVLSVVVGATLGMLVAGFFGLNLFLAIAQEPDESGNAGGQSEAKCALDNPTECLTEEAGIVVTGVILGLGSNPTHEIISGLRKREKERRARLANTARSSGASPTPETFATVRNTA